MIRALCFLPAIIVLAGCANGLTNDATSATDYRCTLALEDTATLERWRETEFSEQLTDSAAREFANCLGHPDPFLRDQIGYEGLSAALRSGQVSQPTRRALISDMRRQMFEIDSSGFRAPFAALGLSELVRTDRIAPFLRPEERIEIAKATTVYLSSVRDFRAYSNTEGWRHGVAHGADLAMQLSLNPNVEAAALAALRQAIADQISGRSGHAFTHGEPERLARPIYFMAAREVFSRDDWSNWFQALATPAPLDDWAAAFQSEADLARLHNLKAFARVLYINASRSENEALKPVAEGALNLLKTLP
ncbi:MAG: DUF2785 domain-containing protein [Pseudomonadota bacterium]